MKVLRCSYVQQMPIGMIDLKGMPQEIADKVIIKAGSLAFYESLTQGAHADAVKCEIVEISEEEYASWVLGIGGKDFAPEIAIGLVPIDNEHDHPPVVTMHVPSSDKIN